MLKLVEFEKLLQTNDAVREEVSTAYAKGIINGKPDLGAIANNLYQILKTRGDFTLEEINKYLCKNEQKVQAQTFLKSANAAASKSISYGYVSLYNLGGFVCDMMVFTPTTSQRKLYHGKNLPLWKKDTLNLISYDNLMRPMREGETERYFCMMPYVYAASGEPIAGPYEYSKNSNRCANFEISGTVWRIKFRKLADTFI